MEVKTDQKNTYSDSASDDIKSEIEDDIKQGIIDSTATETWQVFPSMPVKTNFFKELFTPT